MGTKRIDVQQTLLDVTAAVVDGTITKDEFTDVISAIEVQHAENAELHKQFMQEHGKAKAAPGGKLTPVKIQLNSGSAGGMYILLEDGEIEHIKTTTKDGKTKTIQSTKLTKAGETKPPTRAYKIEVAVESTHNSKRCRGKTTFTIPKGTSISKAVAGLLGKREEMKDTLKANGTLKVEKKTFKKIDSSNRKFKAVYSAWITNKSVNASAGTIKSYNGAYNGAFKNVFDWASRVEQKTFLGKPMLLMATSPGGRGGKSVLDMASDRFPRHDANIVGKFSLPSFHSNFSDGAISNDELNDELLEEVRQFEQRL